jgi:hypothetical protein
MKQIIYIAISWLTIVSTAYSKPKPQKTVSIQTAIGGGRWLPGQLIHVGTNKRVHVFRCIKMPNSLCMIVYGAAETGEDQDHKSPILVREEETETPYEKLEAVENSQIDAEIEAAPNKVFFSFDKDKYLEAEKITIYGNSCGYLLEIISDINLDDIPNH